MFSSLQVRCFYCPESCVARPCFCAPPAPSPGSDRSGQPSQGGCSVVLYLDTDGLPPGECSIPPHPSFPLTPIVQGCLMLPATKAHHLLASHTSYMKLRPQQHSRVDGRASWPSRLQGRSGIPNDTYPPGLGRCSFNSHRGLHSPNSPACNVWTLIWEQLPGAEWVSRTQE